MTGRYRLSPAARADLDEIWNYSAENWGATRADKYVRDLAGALEKLACGKRRGRACDHIRPGYFRYPCQSHVFFYKIDGKNLDVIRILHQRMDFTRRL